MMTAVAATTGVDMEVPDLDTIRQKDSSDPLEAAESIDTPGAMMSGLIRWSEVGPWQEKDARISV